MTPPREWDAATYHRVSRPQVAWGEAVLERLRPRGDETALDAGCGTGRLSAGLCDLLPEGRVVGVDSSLAMLGAARTTGDGRVRHLCGDLVDLPLAGASLDLVFSTATFHWVLDHPRLFTELARVLRPGGRLVAQCGGAGNLAAVLGDAAAAIAVTEVAAHARPLEEGWHFATAAATAARLEAAGFIEVRTRVFDAPVVIEDPGEHRDYLRSVILRPHLAAIADVAAAEHFLDLVAASGRQTDPPGLLDYCRLDIDAVRRG